MKDKVVIITGANSGIGKEASEKFAQAGCVVIMACRNIEKARPVLKEIKNITKNDKIYLKHLDVSDFTSIRRFSEEIKNKYPRLDILINNAAYFNHGSPYQLTPDNVEITFATNVAGPFLLTNLLSDSMKKSDDARVLNASSNIIKHFFSPKRHIDFNNLHGVAENRYKHSVYTSYCNSKMAFLMLTFKLAEHYKSDGIKFYSLQINGSRMSRDTLKKLTPGWRFIAHLQNLFFPHPAFMASNYFTICTSETFRHQTGIHLNHNLEIMKPGPEKTGFKHAWGSEFYPLYAENKEVQQRIWELCSNITSMSSS